MVVAEDSPQNCDHAWTHCLHKFTQNASKMHDLITLKKQQKMYSSDVQHIGKILWKHVCKQLNILSFNWFLFAKKITDVLFRWTH